MAEQMSLEEVLSGEAVVEPEETEETPTEEKPEEAEAPEEEVPETTDEPVEPTGVEETEPPSVETTDKVPLAAMLDERDKRKQLQAELEKLKAAQEEAQKEKVDFWENPEAAVDAKVNEKVTKLEQQFTNGYIALSMQYSKAFHEDFDEAKDAFAKAAKENTALADMALQSEMPGEYIYNTGKQFLELDAVGGDVNALRESIRAEERAKIMAELKEKESKLAEIPTPLTDETSASAPREKVQSGPTPLENIIRSN
jgi:hypothetical protein